MSVLADVHQVRVLTKFPDPHKIPVSLERPFSVKKWAEMRRIPVKSSGTGIGHGILSLQTPIKYRIKYYLEGWTSDENYLLLIVKEL